MTSGFAVDESFQAAGADGLADAPLLVWRSHTQGENAALRPRPLRISSPDRPSASQPFSQR